MSGDYTEREEHVIQILESTQPIPRQEFYRHLANMPWRKEKTTMLQKRTLFATAVCTLMALSIWFVPPLRTLAQEIIDSLFDRAESDEVVYEFRVPANDSESRMQFDSVADAEQYYGVNLFELTTLSDAFRVEGVLFNNPVSEAVTITYTTPDRMGLFILTIYPPEAEQEVYGLISPSVSVERIEVANARGNFDAEYVEGGWGYVPDTDISTESITSNTESLVWYDGPMKRLRWIENGWIFDITTFGDERLLDELVALAERVQ